MFLSFSLQFFAFPSLFPPLCSLFLIHSCESLLCFNLCWSSACECNASMVYCLCVFIINSIIIVVVIAFVLLFVVVVYRTVSPAFKRVLHSQFFKKSFFFCLFGIYGECIAWNDSFQCPRDEMSSPIQIQRDIACYTHTNTLVRLQPSHIAFRKIQLFNAKAITVERISFVVTVNVKMVEMRFTRLWIIKDGYE